MIQQINTKNPSKFRSDDSVHEMRSSRSEVLLRKSVLKICSKFTGEHPCRNEISI